MDTPKSRTINVPNVTAWKLSRISAEVDDMLSRPDHPNDLCYSSNEKDYDYTGDPTTYEDAVSFDNDYDHYNDGYPSDAEDMDECMYSSDEDACDN